MSMLFEKNKRIFNIAGVLTFALTLSLTACNEDGTSPSVISISGDGPGAETPSPLTNSPLKTGGLVCSDSMEVDGRYLEMVSTSSSKPAEKAYYKCENGEWASVSNAEIPVADDLILHKCLGVACLNTRTFADFQKCNAKNEGLVDSTVTLDEGVKYYMCEKSEWNLINGTLAKCTTAETKVGDECCDVIYSTFKVTYPSYSVLYKYTEDGWTNQGVYSDLECKEFSYDPADSCSVPADACTESINNKIDSTLKSAKTSKTCYSLCLNKEWKTLFADEVAVHSYCGEPNNGNDNRCCYTPPAEVTEQYPWYGSAIYVYETYFGWRVKEYYDLPHCKESAE